MPRKSRNVLALVGISHHLNQNATVLFTACGASQLSNAVPEAIFRAMFGASRNLHIYTNGSTTKLPDWWSKGFGIKVGKNLNERTAQWKPWTVTSKNGSVPLRNSTGNLAPGLGANGTFIYFSFNSMETPVKDKPKPDADREAARRSGGW